MHTPDDRSLIIIQMYRMGTEHEREDHIHVGANGDVEITVRDSTRQSTYRFPAETLFKDLLLDYLFNTMGFFALRNPYGTETRAEANDRQQLAPQPRAGAAVDPQNPPGCAYLIRADVFGKKNEIAFSQYACPENLVRLKDIVNRLLSWAQNPRREGNLFLMLDELLNV